MPHSNLPHMQQYRPSYMNNVTHFNFPYPPHPGSPKPTHAPLSRVHSNPTYSLSAPASTSGSPSPLSSDISSPLSDINLLSPSPTPVHTPPVWPPHTQPLFSLANVLSMAMSMAHSFMPAPSLVQAMPNMVQTIPGYQPQLTPQHGYPAMYPSQYAPPVSGEVAYTPGMTQTQYYQTMNSQLRNQDTGFSPPPQVTPMSTLPSGIPVPNQQTAFAQQGMLGNSQYVQESSQEYSLPHGYTPAFPRHSLDQRTSPGSSSGLSSSSRTSLVSRVSFRNSIILNDK